MGPRSVYDSESYYAYMTSNQFGVHGFRSRTPRQFFDSLIKALVMLPAMFTLGDSNVSLQLSLLAIVSMLIVYVIMTFYKTFQTRKLSECIPARFPHFKGPKGLPLVGNIQQVRAEQQWLQYTSTYILFQ